MNDAIQPDDVPADVPDDDDVPDAGESYLDVVSGRVRKRRGSRKRGHGPMSDAEYQMSRAFQGLLRELHWMHGSLADKVCREFTAWFVTSRQALSRYSYGDVPEPTLEDWEALRDELTLPTEVTVTQDFDLGDLK